MSSSTDGDVYPCQIYPKWREGLTHASIYRAGSIRVYSNAVFAELVSFKKSFIRHVKTEENPGNGIYQRIGSNPG
jgi:hypothetical protein